MHQPARNEIALAITVMTRVCVHLLRYSTSWHSCMLHPYKSDPSSFCGVFTNRTCFFLFSGVAYRSKLRRSRQGHVRFLLPPVLMNSFRRRNYEVKNYASELRLPFHYLILLVSLVDRQCVIQLNNGETLTCVHAYWRSAFCQLSKRNLSIDRSTCRKEEANRHPWSVFLSTA